MGASLVTMQVLRGAGCEPARAKNAPHDTGLRRSLDGAFVVPDPYAGRMDLVELRVICPHCGVHVVCVLPVIPGTTIAVVGGSGLAELYAHLWAEHADAEVC